MVLQTQEIQAMVTRYCLAGHVWFHLGYLKSYLYPLLSSQSLPKVAENLFPSYDLTRKKQRQGYYN